MLTIVCRWLLGLPLLTAFACAPAATAPQAAPLPPAPPAPTSLPAPAVAAVARVPFTVDLGGFTTAGELVHPAPDGAHGPGPYPVVLLIHGNGPHDMDVTLPGAKGQPNGPTKLFLQIADTLAARGCAVVRYHKHFVKGPGRFDARFWREQSTRLFTADAGKVLDAALGMAPCDRQRVFLYGWSEGTAVAAALATQRQDIDGLVLQGPCGLPYRAMVQSWIEDVGLPYAQGADGGAVTNADLAAAQTGAGGMVAKLAVSFFVDPASLRTGKPLVSPLLDQNGDGQLDPETEIRAALPDMLDFAFGPQGNCYIYADGRTVPTVTEQAPKLLMPVLILQGEHDASTPRRAGVALHEALVAAGNRATTLMLLPGLGHTLGPCASVFEDAGQAPAEATLVPIAAWLRAQAGG